MATTVSKVKLIGVIVGQMAVINVLQRALVVKGISETECRILLGQALDNSTDTMIDGVDVSLHEYIRDTARECVRGYLDPDARDAGEVSPPFN